MKIQDTIPFTYSLLESSSPGPFKVRGLFGRCDEKNANGRIYTRPLWEKVIESVQSTVNERAMIGEIDHPTISEVKLKEGAFIITGLSLTENGEVHGELEILDNPHGKQLESYFKAKARVGISSRGEGSVNRKDGVDYIGEDYQLHTFDIVSNPSTRGAFPRAVQESTTAVIEQVEPTNMSAEKFAALQGRVREIRSVNLSETTSAHRAEIENTIQEAVQSLDKLAIEDPSYRSATGMLVEDLKDVRKNLGKSPTLETRNEAAGKLAEAAIKRAKKEFNEKVQIVEKARTIINSLREDNETTRTAYAVAIQEGENLLSQLTVAMNEGERVVSEMSALREKYELAIALGQGVVDRYNEKVKGPKGTRVVEKKGTSSKDKVQGSRIREKVAATPAAKKVSLKETVTASNTDQYAATINALNLQY